jgi:hypothetical protein
MELDQRFCECDCEWTQIWAWGDKNYFKEFARGVAANVSSQLIIDKLPTAGCYLLKPANVSSQLISAEMPPAKPPPPCAAMAFAKRSFHGIAK